MNVIIGLNVGTIMPPTLADPILVPMKKKILYREINTAPVKIYFMPWRVTRKLLPVNHSTGIMVILEKKKRQKASTDDGP